MAASRGRCGRGQRVCLCAGETEAAVTGPRPGAPCRVLQEFTLGSPSTCAGRLKSLRGSLETDVQRQRQRQKLLGRSRSKTSFFFPFHSAQATSLLVGITPTEGLPASVGQSSRHTQSHAKPICWSFLFKWIPQLSCPRPRQQIRNSLD